MSTNNIFSPANGAPIISPSQDVVMGCYYMTASLQSSKGDGMKFASIDEVQLAHSLGKVGTHAAITVRLPKGRRVKGDRGVKPGGQVQTTVGRVLFNMALPAGMPYYNTPLRSSDLAGVISDCYEMLGRRKTIDLLDTLNRVGFRQSTLSGLSFATDDLITPPNKSKIIANAEKVVMRIMKLYQRGIITEGERYNQVLDAWTHAREQITTEMMQELENDIGSETARAARGYVNPIFLMAHSGARGGVEQIRQLAGMRGLMAKPSGKIIETPIKANFREGLTVLEYFSSTHGARKGLADTALKTADSGYLTRKLADVAQNVVVTTHDCGTTQGITKGVIYRGEKVEVSLADSIKGRVSRANIVNPITDEVVVRENELITMDVARKIEAMGLEKIQVRSTMTCDAPLGVCALCYGMDLSTGSLVEQGMAVGIIGAQSIGEPGTQLTMRTFHIGGTAARAVEESEIRAKKAGVVQFTRMKVVRNDEGQQVVLTRNGEILLLGPQGPRTGKIRGSRRRQPAGRGKPGGPARHRPLPMGPAQHPDPGGSRRQGPLRGRHRRRNHPHGKGPRRPRPHDRHRVQGRPAPAGRAGRPQRQDSRLLLPARKGQHRGDRRQDRLGRHAVGQDAARGFGHAGHHRRSAAGDGNLRGPQTEGSRRHRRNRRHRGNPRRKTPRQTHHRRQERDRASNASTSSRTASTCAFTRARSSAPASRWSTGRWCRTTSSASPARRPCSSTSSAKSRTSTAASASRSTTSTSRSSSPRCCGRSASSRSATRTCCPAA